MTKKLFFINPTDISKTRTYIVLFIITLLGIMLRIYKINSLPMEMYGDIIEGYNFTQEILQGHWPFYFVLGNGPLFFYFVAVLAKIFGLFFLTMKISSIIVGIGIIISTYFLGKELFDEETGLLCSFLVSVSKWPIIFSRLGNMPILVPLFTSLIILIALKIIKKPKQVLYWILIAILTALGLYIYPGFFITPFTVLLIFVLQGFLFIKKNLVKIIFSLLIFIVFSLPFLRLFFGNLQVWTSSTSYMGSKIFVSEGKLAPDWPIKIIYNIKKTIVMFYRDGYGDVSFRNNPTGQKAIDFISGILLLIGIITIINKEKRKKITLLLIIVFSLMIPSIMVLNAELDVPNMNRTIGSFPFIFLLIALGFKQLRLFIQKTTSRNISIITISIPLVIVTILNYQMYFNNYSYSLPNHNEGFPQLIAKEVDKIENNVLIVMYGGGWGDWSQPDWRAVNYEFRQPKSYLHFEYKQLNCQFLEQKKQSIFFILNPNSPENLNEVKECFHKGEITNYFSPIYHFPLFTSYFIK